MSDFAADCLGIAKALEGMTEVPRRAAELAAPELAKVVQSEFSAGSGPNGQGWAPLKAGGSSHLDETGRMRGRLTVVADGLLVRGKLPPPANIHQGSKGQVRHKRNGASTGVLPQRPIFPSPDGPLPPSWEAELDKAAEKAVAELSPKGQ